MKYPELQLWQNNILRKNKYLFLGIANVSKHSLCIFLKQLQPVLI